MKKIAVLVSGGGTNLQALIDAQKNNIIKSGEISLVISSKEGVYALERADKNNIKSCVISPKAYNCPEDFHEALLAALEENNIDLVVLAGYLCILPPLVTQAYNNRIINVHPSLIPSFCGEGYHGLKVHRAALEYGVKITGATVHYVNEIVDGGKIIMQKAVDIKIDDTPEILQKRVMEEAEWEILPLAVEFVCSSEV